MYGVVVHPGVVLANQSSNPRSPPPEGRKPLGMQLRPHQETHALPARRHTHPAFRAFSRKFLQPNYPQYLQLQGGHSRAESLFFSKANNDTSSVTEGSCLFGEVVDNAMVMEEFGMAPTTLQINRARLALRLMNDDEKKGQASRYVANLKDKHGYGASTLCLVYNATGDALHYSDNHNWSGVNLHGDDGYPKKIGNGQWAAFLHVHGKGDTTGSAGAVVYRGKNRRDEDRDFLLAWYTPWSLKQHNKAYCRISAVVTSYDEGLWKEIKIKLDKSSYTSSTSTDDVVEVDAQTERGTSPTFTAIIKSVREQ
ncbi:hypothetical protein BS78_05G076400 [Paspalum vaginatum]|nr:hypothetical protein BS78_05G076400 [Paspalum vaginatum]